MKLLVSIVVFSNALKTVYIMIPIKEIERGFEALYYKEGRNVWSSTEISKKLYKHLQGLRRVKQIIALKSSAFRAAFKTDWNILDENS